VGQQSAEIVQSMIYSAANRSSGTLATIIGIGTLVLTATGTFGEIQTSLNVIWRAEASTNLSQLVRARLLSLGLVVTLGFLMLVSLVVSAALTALGDYLNVLFPAGHLLMSAVSFTISLTLIAVLFAAIYKVLPDKPIDWCDVAVGAAVTAVLFTVGKSVIGLYIGSSTVASSYGAAGAFLIILLWVYYSAQIFLLGAEFTRAYAERHGSHASGHQIDDGPNAVLQPKNDLHVSSARIPAERAAYRS
jgi:membrane protein